MTGHGLAAMVPRAAMRSARRPSILERGPRTLPCGAHAETGCFHFEAPKRPPLASSLDFLSVTDDRGAELKPVTRVKGIDDVECDESVFAFGQGVRSSQGVFAFGQAGRSTLGQWPPAPREGRMELQGCGINTECVDIIVQHLARRPAELSGQLFSNLW